MRRVFIAVALLAGCGGGTGGGGGDDIQVSDAQASSDAPPQQHGLLVSFGAIPALPGPVKPDLVVTSASFRVQRLQVIGDNGQPMTSAAFQLGWQAEGTNPEPLSFASAPSGLYSQVSIEIDNSSNNTVYEIYGTTKMGPGPMMETFHIIDTQSIDVDIMGYNITLPPGGDAVVPVYVDLKDALESVNFGALPMNGGMREMTATNAQMPEFRDKLEKGFKRMP